MESFFVLLIIGAILYFCAKIKANLEKQKKENNPTRKSQPEEKLETKRQLEEECVVIQDEIRAQVKKQSPAVRILQALSRIDGTSSKAEQNLILDFLNRNGATLTNERHRPHFSNSVSGEWNSAVEIDDFKRLITPLSSMALPYRIDVFATASAIVAVGGAPRKRESEALDLLSGLIQEKASLPAREMPPVKNTAPTEGDDEYEGSVYIVPDKAS